MCSSDLVLSCRISELSPEILHESTVEISIDVNKSLDIPFTSDDQRDKDQLERDSGTAQGLTDDEVLLPLQPDRKSVV